MFQVNKRDGSKQPFDKSKIVTALINAGASGEISEQVASSIEAWIPSVAANNEISSLVIKERIVAEVEALDTTLAEKIKSYVK